MLTSTLTNRAGLCRVNFSGKRQPSSFHTALVSPCQASRRYYRGSRLSDDVSPYLDLVADVLAGVESAYAASQRSRDSSAYTSRRSEGRGPGANKNQEYTDTTASAEANAEDASETSRGTQEAAREPYWKPVDVMQAVPVDIEEHADGYTLYMDVPGLQKSDVKVQIIPSQRKMTISGERSRITKEEADSSDRSYRRRFERRMGKFSRTLNLAKDLDVKSVIARVDHGVLTVTAKKLAPQEPEAMEISID